MRAEKMGHYGALWVLKILVSMLSAARGELAQGGKEAAEAWNFGETHFGAVNFIATAFRGHFAALLGNVVEAETWFTRGLKMENEKWSYLSGISEASLFAVFAENHDDRAGQVWKNRQWKLPISGQLNSLGRWAALERSAIGLASLGKKQDVGALRSLTEELVLTGAWTYGLLSPFRTVAGIAAACVGDWSAAEQHHLTAIHQTDSAPYRHLRPVAREWYATMLLDRQAPGTVTKARILLSEALTLYESLGMSSPGRRIGAKVAAL